MKGRVHKAPMPDLNISIFKHYFIIFFNFRRDFEQFYQKEMVKVLKQPNSKSITVLREDFIQHDKKIKIGAEWSGGFMIVIQLLFG